MTDREQSQFRWRVACLWKRFMNKTLTQKNVREIEHLLSLDRNAEDKLNYVMLLKLNERVAEVVQ
jgi:hypothetical protein